MTSSAANGVPDGKPVEARTVEAIDPFAGAHEPPAPPREGDPPAAPGRRTEQAHVDVPVRPGDAR